MKYLSIGLLLLSTAAFADEPRKIDFTVILTDMDGAQLLECADNPQPKDDRDCKVRSPVTLGMISFRALVQLERDIPMDENLKRGQLGLSIYKSNSSTLTTDEITLIKKQIAKAYSPLIVAKTFPILDPASAKDQK